MVAKRCRPYMPEEYGIHSGPEGMLSWSWVRQEMVDSRNYWVVSTRPNGHPHVAPVWGVWLDDVFFFSTDRRSRKALNLASNPRSVVHLESGDEVVIVEGEVEEVSEQALLDGMDDAYFGKYRIHPTEMSGAMHFALHPKVVMAWLERDFPRTATKWMIEAT